MDVACALNLNQVALPRFTFFGEPLTVLAIQSQLPDPAADPAVAPGLFQ